MKYLLLLLTLASALSVMVFPVVWSVSEGYLLFTIVMIVSLFCLIIFGREQPMRYDLVSKGAKKLLPGYTYRLHLVEVHGELAEVSVSVVRERCRKVLWFCFGIPKRLGTHRILIGDRSTRKNPGPTIIETANRLAEELNLTDETG